MNGCELKKCRFWDGEKCNDKNDWISAENGEHCCGLRSDAVLVEKEKRKPLSDGTLLMTEEELEEFSKITGLGIILVELIAGSIYISYRTETGEEENGYVTDVKAILWLADRFELVEK